MSRDAPKPVGRPVGWRKPDAATKTINARVTPAQLAEYTARGGIEWLRRVLDRKKKSA